MSQQAVEGILGRLITDAEFREQFFRDPYATCQNLIKDAPTIQEIAALAGLDRGVLSRLAEVLDPKIVRAIGIGDAA
jgi:hypothetical protein